MSPAEFAEFVGKTLQNVLFPDGDASLEDMQHLFQNPKAYRGRALWRYKADLRFSEDGLHEGELARAQPDDPVRWTKYTVTVHPGLRDAGPDLVAILAHELGHVILGLGFGASKKAIEDACDLFACSLLSLPPGTMGEIRDRRKSVLVGTDNSCDVEPRSNAALGANLDKVEA